MTARSAKLRRMNAIPRKRKLKGLLLALCVYAGHLAAASPQLDAAIKTYYAGKPAEAIAMIEPLAAAGDARAQYVLGNILYTLSSAGRMEAVDAALDWYRSAAKQGSMQASYALGAVYNNRWLESKRDADARLAETHFLRALELGEPRARTALNKLRANLETRGKTTSLRYTNESFSSTRTQSPEPEAAAKPRNPAPGPAAAPKSALDELANFRSSGDTAADVKRLRELVDRLYTPLEAATELGTAPGAN